MIYFDVRPSAHVPTIEMRVCDACPSVDTVVLIAALFRAVVVRERERYERGRAVERRARRRCTARRCGARPARASRASWSTSPVRAPCPPACWCGACSKSCGPSSSATAAGAVTQELCAEALARGSSAARQREALRRRERVSDVVDAVVAETAGRAAHRAPEAAPPLIPGYQPARLRRGRAADGPPAPVPRGRPGDAAGDVALRVERPARCPRPRQRGGGRDLPRQSGSAPPAPSRSTSCPAS